MRFILGGLPFGCDNIGDEAILAGIVKILRKIFSDAEITVCTNTPTETAKLLNVKTLPLFGFRKEHSIAQFSHELKKNDVFIWSGATGLSDYPETAVKILNLAKDCGLKTIVWGVGMDSVLNPAFFTVRGKKLALCRLLNGVFLGRADFAKKLENFLTDRQKTKIAAALKRTDLIVVRDFQTRDILLKIDPTLKVNVGADSALIFTSPDLSRLERLSPKVKEALFSDSQKIGLCVSAQRAVRDLSSLAQALDTILQPPNRKLFLIPMNPVTDSVLMDCLTKKMANADRVFSLKSCTEPEDVLAAVSLCSVVVSSRLHLLILSANAGTPIVGISRGSKVDNFLENFSLKSAGSVGETDFGTLKFQVEKMLSNPSDFKIARDAKYAEFAARENSAEKLLLKTVTKSKI